MSCNECGKENRELASGCCTYGAAKKTSAYGRPMLVTGALAAILIVSGCTGTDGSSEKTPAEVIESVDGEQGKPPSSDLGPAYVKVTDTVMLVKDLETQAMYKTTFSSEGEQVKLFVLPAKSGEVSVIQADEAGFAGQEGEELYKGELAFFLAEPDGEEGYLQELETSDHMVNVSQEPFTAREIGDLAIVQLSEPVTSDAKELSLWTVQSGKLVTVSVDGQPTISTATSDLKIVGDRYFQTYDYFNTDPNGWAFRTYEWNPEKAALTLYDETELLVEGPFRYDGMEADIREYYQSMVDNWNRISDYTYPFPHLQYPKDLTARLENGYLLDEEGKVGSSLEKYMERNPDHLGEYDAEGSWFYAYPDGQSFYFDRGVDKIEAVQLSGANYTESISELKGILGEPLHDSKDDPPSEEDEWLVGSNYDIGDVLSYEFGEYQVEVMHRDEKVEAIVVREKFE